MSPTARHRLTLAVLALLATGFGVSRCSPPPPPAISIQPNKIAENEIRSMVEQVQLYRETRSGLPSDLTELTKANLIKNAQEDGSVLDPWKRPYVYQLDQTAKEGFVILSQGADPNTEEDDIRSDRFGKK